LLGAALQSQLSNIADVLNAKAVPDLFKLNDFTDLAGLPKIVPTRIQTPTLSELSLMLRAMGLNIAGDRKLLEYLRHILGMPNLDEDTFETVYLPQMKSDMQNNDNFVDESDKLFEQNDKVYT
jgi:hypothetical protein